MSEARRLSNVLPLPLAERFAEVAGLACCVVHRREYRVRVFAGRASGCAACAAADMAAVSREEQLQARAGWVDAAMQACGLPPRYQCFGMADLRADDAEALGVWLADALAGGDGALVLLGPVGVGKTAAAAALLRELIGGGKRVRYVTAAGLLDAIRATWGRLAQQREDQVLAPYLAADVLVLDDVGASRGVENDAWRLAGLLGERYDQLRPTVVVSNLSPANLIPVIGERAFDRLRDAGMKVVINGKSRRASRSSMNGSE